MIELNQTQKDVLRTIRDGKADNHEDIAGEVYRRRRARAYDEGRDEYAEVYPANATIRRTIAELSALDLVYETDETIRARDGRKAGQPIKRFATTEYASEVRA